jgi:CCR4-NOT complex subunit CAF16
MSNSNGTTKVEDVSIKVKHLSYSFQDGSSGLQDVVLDLPQGSRTLLIGGTC